MWKWERGVRKGVKGTEVGMERHAGGGEGPTGRGQEWLSDACLGRWGKVNRKEGGNGKRRGAAEGDGRVDRKEADNGETVFL